MKKRFNYFLLLIFICLSVSCTESIDLPFPEHSPQVVLNGLLNPDSIIKIQLSWSKPLGTERKFPPIENAIIKVYENEKLIGASEHRGQGNYILSYFPKSNFTYKVEVNVPNYGLVTAQDRVPDKADIKRISYTVASVGFGQGFNLKIEIDDHPTENNYYWLTSFRKDYKNGDYDFSSRSFFLKDSITYTRGAFLLYSNDIYTDKFNATFDASSGYYGYRNYIRVEDAGLNGKTIPITFYQGGFFLKANGNLRQLDKNQALWIDVVSASTEYDKYFKSSFIHYLNTNAIEGNSPNPFAEPIKIYTNVNNGLGIFAAYNLYRISVR
jgi:hypothetical protein